MANMEQMNSYSSNHIDKHKCVCQYDDDDYVIKNNMNGMCMPMVYPDDDSDNTNFFADIGVVNSVYDGIANMDGLNEVAYGEVVEFVSFETNTYAKGMILNLEEDSVSAIILEDDSHMVPSMLVVSYFELMCVPVGESLLGSVLNPLGLLLDNDDNNEKNEVLHNKVSFMESSAPSIISRSPVNKSLETGLKVIDSLMPMGHGQSELIMGDAKTGKTSIAMDTILNQKEKDIMCMYVAMGQKSSSVASMLKVLSEKGCMGYTVLVSATASDTAALQYLAPYSGCSIGEYFMKRGLNVLVVYDDLSKHAVAYSQLSLLLSSPPGREGYPGDVFYLHSRLLESAANLSGGGSLTALPIIETMQGDVSAYIPTNVISITDGQIFLETELFTKGMSPAVSPGLSVSSVGSAAQNKIMKSMAASLKLELAQYSEVEDFTKLGFVLDESTKSLVERGVKLTQLLIQNSFLPVDMVDQTILLYSALNGFLDGIPVSLIGLYEFELYSFLKSSLFYVPLQSTLSDEMDMVLIEFILSLFKEYFIENIVCMLRPMQSNI